MGWVVAACGREPATTAAGERNKLQARQECHTLQLDHHTCAALVCPPTIARCGCWRRSRHRKVWRPPTPPD
eukprot:164225-Chlamydomonas_euryale.AAC.2